MPREVRFDERQMRQMIETLRQSARQLQQVQDEMSNQASKVTGGALLGDAGETFSRSLRTTLNGKIDELVQELRKEADTVERELEQMLSAQRSG